MIGLFLTVTLAIVVGQTVFSVGKRYVYYWFSILTYKRRYRKAIAEKNRLMVEFEAELATMPGIVFYDEATEFDGDLREQVTPPSPSGWIKKEFNA